MTALRQTQAMALAGTALLVLSIANGCRSGPPPKPLELLNDHERAGHHAYVSNCGMCHNDRQTGSLHGPSLRGVYKKRYLPSGTPANDDRIRLTILYGRGNMPALGGSVDSDQIDDILAYLKTL